MRFIIPFLFFLVAVSAKAQLPYNPQSGTCGTTPTVNAVAGATLVLKTSNGTLCSLSVTNVTATTGFVLVLNATSAPVDGVVTPTDCKPLAANGSITINWTPALYLSTGITIVVSSNASCFTKTTGVITAFISGSAL